MRGRGFPAGFPPRGFPPPMIGGRGGRGRGGHQQFHFPGGGGRGREGRQGGGGDDPGGEENPLLSAIDKTSKDRNKEEALGARAIEENQSKNLFSGQVSRISRSTTAFH